VHALAELNQRRGIEPQIGNVPADRLLDDRLGGGTECRPLAADDEPLQLGLEVELGIRGDQIVDQPDRQLAGRQPDRLVVVGVDHVVARALALDLAGLAASHVVADGLLQLQRHMLGHVPDPGAFVQALDETAAPAAAARVVLQAGQPRHQSVRETGQLVGGEFLEHSEVDHQLDGRLVVPHVRPAVHPAGDDLQIRMRSRSGALGHGLSLTRIGCW
jgi:hypothetical protein